MKNILKYLSALCAILLFASCPNQLEIDNISSGAKSGIRITVSGEGVNSTDKIGSRTLFPSKPNFTKFELHFENINGQNTYNTIELDINKNEITIEDLKIGEWKITAVGFITINGNFVQAADGAVKIEVKPWENGKTTFQSVNIPISVKQGGENGSFFYNVDFPSTVNTAGLYIYNIGGSPWDVHDPYIVTPLGENEPVDMIVKKSGTFPLAPGYYMMTMKFDNGYKAVSWTEVIHIYPLTVTEMIKVFDNNLISGVITLSGNASVLIDGDRADWASIYLYSDSHCSNYFAHIDVNEKGEMFPITMLALDRPTTFYMKMNAGFGDSFYTRQLGHLTLHRDDHEFNINEIFETITLSGTSSVKINGNNPRDVYIFAYRADNDELLTVNAANADLRTGRDGAWKMTFEAFKTPVEVYFEVQAVSMNYSSYYKRADNKVPAFKDDISNIFIEVDVGLLTVSGTVNLTINGKTPLWANITMRKWEDNYQFIIDENGREIIVDENNDEVFTDWLDTNEVDFKNGNAWILGIENLKEPIKIYFEYECTDAKGNYFSGRVKMPALTLYNSNLTNIVLNIDDIRVVTLSGTAEISVNGKAPLWASVSAYNLDVQIGYSWIELNQFPVIGQDKDGNDIYSDEENPNYKKWSIGLTPFTESTNVRFVVSGMYLYNTGVNGNDIFEERFFERNVTSRSVFNQDIDNIALNISITPKEITLSGTVNLTQGFLVPDKNIEITAIIQNGGSDYNTPIGSTVFDFAPGANSWSIKIMSFDSPTSVRFRIRWSAGGDDGETYFIFPTTGTTTVEDSDISGISLSNRTLNPSYTFRENTGEPRWTAIINPSWLLKGKQVKEGEYYKLTYSFTTNSISGNLNAVMMDLSEDAGSDNILSDDRRVDTLTNQTSYSGTVVFTISKSALSSKHWANSLYLKLASTSNTAPVLTFTNLVIEDIKPDPTISEWTAPSGQKFNIIGPGITTTANIVNNFNGRNNVLHVEPGKGGYYHYIITYDLSQYANQTIIINITTDVWLNTSSRVAWQLDSSGYPLVCGSTANALDAGQWNTITGSRQTTVPESGAGRLIFLSAQQLGNAHAYFSNFNMTITVP
ncbi:MAG: hypothetical protein FWB73_02980 [Treponema sp.]|nr:hypothetical protein [Treponema sp.]